MRQVSSTYCSLLCYDTIEFVIGILSFLDTNVASILKEKCNQTESVAGHIPTSYKGYKWSVTLFNMTLFKLRLIGHTNVRCVFITSNSKTIYQTIRWPNAVAVAFNIEIKSTSLIISNSVDMIT